MSGFKLKLTAFGLFLGLIVFAPSSLTAVEGGGRKSAFELGGSARALGMGDACVAVGDEGGFFIKNPAALSSQRQKEISTFHTSLFVDTSYDSIGLMYPISRGALGASFTRVATSDIPRTLDSVVPTGTFNAQQWQGMLGFGSRIWKNISMGSSIKFRRQSLDNYADSGMGLDAGLLFRLSRDVKDFTKFGYRNISLGLSASNVLSPEIRLAETGDQPPLILHPALAYRYLSKSMKSSLWLSFEGEWVRDGETLVKSGLEYGWQSRFFMRCGWDGRGPTAGAGFFFKGFRLDYAFNRPELGTTHRFSLNYRFGYVNDNEQSRRVQLLKTIARTYEDAGQYDQARSAWGKVMEESPDDPEGISGISGVETKRNQAVREQVKKAKEAMLAGDMLSAIPALTMALNLDPGDKEARDMMNQVDKKLVISQNYLQGLESYQTGDFATAVKFFSAVRAADPGYRDTARYYSDAKSRTTPLESFPPETARLYSAGANYFIKGDFEKAIGAWEMVLKKAPGNFLVQRNIAEARNRMKDKPAQTQTTPVEGPKK